MNKVNKPSKMRQLVVFLIFDEANNPCGVASSRLQARVQIAWHLPKGKSYRIEPKVTYTT